jgi:eukaryotic-like serine/threonine-protein kinase
MPSATPPDGGSHGRDTTGARETGEGPAEIRLPDPIHETATIVGGAAGLAPSDRPRADDGTAAPVGLEEFRRTLVDIEIVAADELETLAAGVPPSEGVLGLARALQKAGRLTAYQAAALYQRKSRGLLIGNYLILDKLGAGGMGMVFKARHRKLGRVVAVKILPPSFARDRTAVLRFQREVEAAGRLKHPNIVAALDANEDRGVHFLVMEYVEGRDLDGVVRQCGPLSVPQAIDYLTQAARGLEAAHAEGIVHRDIKPSNLMLDAQGAVRVLDLGLARMVDASNPFGQVAGGRLTESGMYMGTVDYMAPEQADDSRLADHRADIYGLGCTIHYLLTGREPFTGETVLKRLMAHQERPAPLLRATRPDVPAALDDTFQKMLAKRPADRPPSMTAVITLLEACRIAAAEAPRSAQRLMVFDNAATRPAKSVRDVAPPGVPESLHVGSELSFEDLVMDVRPEVPAPTIKRALSPRAAPSRRSQPPVLKPTRRSTIWIPVTAVAAVLTVGLLGLVVTTALNGPRRGAPRPPEAATGPLSTEPERITTNDPRDHPPLSTRIVPTPAESKPKTSTSTTPERTRVIGDRTRSLDGEHVYLAAFAPDGKSYATAGDRATVRIFNTQDGALIRSIKQEGWVQSINFSGNGTRLFANGYQTRIYTWDAASGTELGRCDSPEFASLERVAYAPDGVLAIIAHPEGNLRLWDLTVGKRLHRLPRARGGGYCFTPDSQDVVVQSYYKPLGRYTVQRIAARDNVPRWSVRVSGIEAPANGCWCVPATGDLVTVYNDGTVLVHDVADGSERRRLSLGMAIHAGCSGLALDGRRLLTGHDDNTVRLWSLPDCGLLRQFTLDTSPTGPPAFSPDGRFAVAHSFRGQQYFWRLPEPGPVDRNDSLAGAKSPARPSVAAAGPSLMENARSSFRLNQPERAVPLYEKALKERPDDSGAWVEYGRMLAALGRHTDADDAFLRAAKLAPGEFGPYLSHWWIVGPFAFDVRAMEAPQNRPDPSRPIPAPTPRPWRLVQADPDGWVDLAEFFSPSSRVSAYALTYLYTREERELALSLTADDFVRVWLNGKLAFEHVRGPALPATTIPRLMLQPGRNTLLIKVANDRVDFTFGVVPLSSHVRSERPARAL